MRNVHSLSGDTNQFELPRGACLSTLRAEVDEADECGARRRAKDSARWQHDCGAGRITVRSNDADDEDDALTICEADDGASHSV